MEVARLQQGSCVRWTISILLFRSADYSDRLLGRETLHRRSQVDEKNNIPRKVVARCHRAGTLATGGLHQRRPSCRVIALRRTIPRWDEDLCYASSYAPPWPDLGNSAR